MNGTRDVQGIAAMVAATATFVVADSFMKLVTADLPPFEVLFLRGVAASLGCAILVSVRGEWSGISGTLDYRALLRATAETISTLCYVVALARMPIADVIAILQTAPLILILGAALLLRERIGVSRVVLALVGFIGAVVVAQPAGNGLSSAALLAFAAALFIAARDLIGRGVPMTIPAAVVIFTTTLTVMVAAGALSLGLETRVAPTAGHLGYLTIAGLLVALGQIGLLLAYRLGRTATIAPFFYSFAFWGVVAGLVVWRALPNAVALAGIVLIVGSGVAIIVLDQRRHRSAIPLTEAL